MTSAQVVETSVKVTPNSPSQDFSHPDDHNLRTYDMTPGFKPFTVINSEFAMLGNILQQPSQAPNWQAPPHFMYDSQRYQSSMPSSFMPSDNTGMYFGDSNQYTKP